MLRYVTAFQTISIRSVYIKIINYSYSILANLNKICTQYTMQRKKPHSYLNRNKIYKGLFFCGGRIFSRKCSKSSVLFNSISWNCIQYKQHRGVTYLNYNIIMSTCNIIMVTRKLIMLTRNIIMGLDRLT